MMLRRYGGDPIQSNPEQAASPLLAGLPPVKLGTPPPGGASSSARTLSVGSPVLVADGDVLDLYGCMAR